MENKLTVLKGVPKALKTLEEKLQALSSLQNFTPKTDGELKWNPKATWGMDIFEMNFEELVNAYGYVWEKHVRYTKLAEELGNKFKIKSYKVFTWQGFTWEDWKHDFEAAFAMLGSQEEKERLTKLKNLVATKLSEEDRFAMKLAELDGGELFADLFSNTEDTDIEIEE